MRSALSVLAGFVALIGCGSEAPTAPIDRTGVVTLAMTNTPPDVRCLELTIEHGDVETRTIDLVPSQPAVFSVDDLPIGEVTLSEYVYTQPCNEIEGNEPKWESNSVTVELTKGVPVNVYFTLYPFGTLGEVIVHSDFPSPLLPLVEYSLGSNRVGLFLTSGPDNALWFTAELTGGGYQLGRVNSSNGAMSLYTAPESLGPIAAGADGNFWIGGSAKLLKATSSGVFTIIPMNGVVNGTALGPDGKIWYTVVLAGVIGNITPAGAITQYQLSGSPYPRRIAPGPDGRMWVTDWGNPSRIHNVSTAGQITSLDLPSGWNTFDVTAGSDGNVWATVGNQQRVLRITQAGSMEFIPTLTPQPAEITSGSDGNLWVTHNTYPVITRVTPQGAVRQFSLPSGSHVRDITSGPDGNVWMMMANGKIARFNPNAVY